MTEKQCAVKNEKKYMNFKNGSNANLRKSDYYKEDRQRQSTIQPKRGERALKRMKPSSSTDFVAEYIGSVHGETIKRVFMQDEPEPVNEKDKKHKSFLHKNK